MENLLDLIFEPYKENNPVEKNTVAGKTAKAKEKELEDNNGNINFPKMGNLKFPHLGGLIFLFL